MMPATSTQRFSKLAQSFDRIADLHSGTARDPEVFQAEIHDLASAAGREVVACLKDGRLPLPNCDAWPWLGLHFGKEKTSQSWQLTSPSKWGASLWDDGSEGGTSTADIASSMLTIRREFRPRGSIELWPARFEAASYTFAFLEASDGWLVERHPAELCALGLPRWTAKTGEGAVLSLISDVESPVQVVNHSPGPLALARACARACDVLADQVIPARDPVGPAACLETEVIPLTCAPEDAEAAQLARRLPDQRKRELVLRALRLLRQQECEYIEVGRLAEFGLPPTTVESYYCDLLARCQASDKVRIGGAGTGGTPQFQRQFLLDYILLVWKPRRARGSRSHG